MLIAPKPSPAAQKGLNIQPTTKMRAAPKVEPPPGGAPADLKSPPGLATGNLTPSDMKPPPGLTTGIGTPHDYEQPPGSAADIAMPSDLKLPPGGGASGGS